MKRFGTLLAAAIVLLAPFSAAGSAVVHAEPTPTTTSIKLTTGNNADHVTLSDNQTELTMHFTAPAPSTTVGGTTGATPSTTPDTVSFTLPDGVSYQPTSAVPAVSVNATTHKLTVDLTKYTQAFDFTLKVKPAAITSAVTLTGQHAVNGSVVNQLAPFTINPAPGIVAAQSGSTPTGSAASALGGSTTVPTSTVKENQLLQLLSEDKTSTETLAATQTSFKLSFQNTGTAVAGDKLTITLPTGVSFTKADSSAVTKAGAQVAIDLGKLRGQTVMTFAIDAAHFANGSTVSAIRYRDGKAIDQAKQVKLVRKIKLTGRSLQTTSDSYIPLSQFSTANILVVTDQASWDAAWTKINASSNTYFAIDIQAAFTLTTGATLSSSNNHVLINGNGVGFVGATGTSPVLTVTGGGNQIVWQYMTLANSQGSLVMKDDTSATTNDFVFHFFTYKGAAALLNTHGKTILSGNNSLMQLGSFTDPFDSSPSPATITASAANTTDPVVRNNGTVFQQHSSTVINPYTTAIPFFRAYDVTKHAAVTTGENVLINYDSTNAKALGTINAPGLFSGYSNITMTNSTRVNAVFGSKSLSTTLVTMNLPTSTTSADTRPFASGIDFYGGDVWDYHNYTMSNPATIKGGYWNINSNQAGVVNRAPVEHTAAVTDSTAFVGVQEVQPASSTQNYSLEVTGAVIKNTVSNGVQSGHLFSVPVYYTSASKQNPGVLYGTDTVYYNSTLNVSALKLTGDIITFRSDAPYPKGDSLGVISAAATISNSDIDMQSSNATVDSLFGAGVASGDYDDATGTTTGYNQQAGSSSVMLAIADETMSMWKGTLTGTPVYMNPRISKKDQYGTIKSWINNPGYTSSQPATGMIQTHGQSQFHFGNMSVVYPGWTTIGTEFMAAQMDEFFGHEINQFSYGSGSGDGMKTAYIDDPGLGYGRVVFNAPTPLSLDPVYISLNPIKDSAGAESVTGQTEPNADVLLTLDQGAYPNYVAFKTANNRVTPSYPAMMPTAVNVTVKADASGKFTYSIPSGEHFNAGQTVKAVAYTADGKGTDSRLVTDGTPPTGTPVNYVTAIGSSMPDVKDFVTNLNDNYTPNNVTVEYGDPSIATTIQTLLITGTPMVGGSHALVPVPLKLTDQAGNVTRITANIQVIPEDEAARINATDITVNEDDVKNLSPADYTTFLKNAFTSTDTVLNRNAITYETLHNGAYTSQPTTDIQIQEFATSVPAAYKQSTGTSTIPITFVEPQSASGLSVDITKTVQLTIRQFGPTSPKTPTNPTTDAPDPGNPGTGATGQLRLDYVPDFNFGVQDYYADAHTYNAEQALGMAGTQIDDWVQVSDDMPASANQNWALTAALSDAHDAGTLAFLPGMSITLPGMTAYNSNSGATQYWTGPLYPTAGATLNLNGASEHILAGDNVTGTSTAVWDSTQVQLSTPAGHKVIGQQYQATIDWSLEAVPGN